MAPSLGMWVAMMVAMMLPSATPMLWRYRQAVAAAGAARPALPIAVAVAGYLFVWTAISVATFPMGVALDAAAMDHHSHAVPVALGAIVSIGGAYQFSKWKAHHLACCRQMSSHGTISADARAAWRRGVRLGFHCARCCANLMAILLVIGAMNVRAMAVVGMAIALERLTPDGHRFARLTGAVFVGAGLLLVARAGGFG